MMRTLLLIALVSILAVDLSAQVPMGGNCPGGLVLATDCQSSCVTCDGLDGYADMNSNGPGVAPPGHCAPQIHNPRWIGFVAGSSDITFDINVGDCMDGNGLQIGVFSTNDCINFSSVMNCEPGIPPNTTATFSGSGLTVGGTYFIVIDGSFDDVCDFDLDLVSGSMTAPDLTSAPPPQVAPSAPSVCPGGTINFNAEQIFGADIYTWVFQGVEYGFDPNLTLTAPSVPGTYTVCVTPSNPCNTGNQGCTTFDVMDLMPIQEPPVTLCFGESIPFHGLILFETGSYTAFEVTPQGCTQEYNIDVTVVNPTSGPDENVTICEGEIFWTGGSFGDGFAIDTEGTYDFILQSSQGCDSLQTFIVDVIDAFDEDISPTICDGESVTVSDTQGNSFTYDTQGNFVADLQTVDGCDSTVNVMLTVVQAATETLDIVICPGETYTVNGNTYDMSGTYVEMLTSAGGCDSTLTLNLTLDNPTTDLGDIEICPAGSYTIAGQTFTGAGDYSYTLPSAQGCDSIINLTLVELGAIETDLTQVICDDETFTFDGNDLNVTGVYEVVYSAVGGCDSTVTLDLTVLETPEVDIVATICTGQSYNLGGEMISVAGIYERTYTAANGCDSTVTLDLSVGDGFITNLTPVLCDGESITVANQVLDTGGLYSFDLSSTTGCDSTVNVDLTILPLTTGIQPASICDGESFDYEGTSYTMAGLYDVVLTGPNGCDSTVTINLEVRQPVVNNMTMEICSGQTVTIGSSTYDASGSYTDNFTGSNGCDSTVNLTLTVTDVLMQFETITICDDESVTVGSDTYNTSGDYQNDFITTEGCDSSYFLTLVVNPSLTETVDATICDDEIFNLAGVDHNTTGVYTYQLSSALTGCDSTVTLNLDVLPTYDIDIDAEFCTGGSYTLAGQTFTAAGDYDIMLQSVDGCDSTLHLNLVQTPFLQTDLERIICEGESVTIGSSTYNTSGNFSDMFTSQDGCDSVVNLALTVNPLLSTTLDIAICDGEEYDLGGEIFDTGGSYTRTFSSLVSGCDSTVTLNLEVNPVFITNVAEIICDGESVTIGSSVYTETGTYSDDFTTGDGCDSTVVLSLIVNEVPTTELNEVICDGETFPVGSSNYDSPGTYVETLTAQTGCDSIVTLNLTVNEVPVVDLTEEICEGQIFRVGTSVYFQSGTYTDILSSLVTGCDSIVNLNLTVNPTYATTMDESICDDETFTIAGLNFDAAGIYNFTLFSEAGCDSVITLNLTTFPCELNVLSNTTDVKCNGGADGTFSLAILKGTPPFQVDWLNFNTLESGQFFIDDVNLLTSAQDLSAGPHVISVEDANGVIWSTELIINEPDGMGLTLTVSDYGGVNVSCLDASDGFIDIEVAGGTPPYSFDWSGGSNEGLGAGDYSVVVTDAQGCQATASATLTEPTEIRASLNAISPACVGQESGSIAVEAISGGTPPYLYSIDNDPFVSSPLFSNVEPGTHRIQVQDANGCGWVEEAVIEAPQALLVSLGDDVQISLGDSLQLFPETTRPVVAYSWQAGGPISCDNEDPLTCPTPFVAPQESTTYRVVVTDENGCTGTDQITIFVDKPRDVFFPTGFSPNGDGSNDVFMIFAGNDVAVIRNFAVYNRWGESLMEIPGPFQPNDPTFGWDGSHRGQMMNAGVYVYYAEVEFIDGEVIQFKGDVVLLK